MKIYLDSNVLISTIRDEIDKKFRLLAEEARAFFNFVEKNKTTLVVSDLFLIEVENKTGLDKKSVFEFFRQNNLETIELGWTKNDIITSKKIEQLGIHSTDAKHIAMAINAKCDTIATFNIKDFKKAKKFIEIKQPLDFI